MMVFSYNPLLPLWTFESVETKTKTKRSATYLVVYIFTRTVIFLSFLVTQEDVCVETLKGKLMRDWEGGKVVDGSPHILKHKGVKEESRRLKRCFNLWRLFVSPQVPQSLKSYPTNPYPDVSILWRHPWDHKQKEMDFVNIGSFNIISLRQLSVDERQYTVRYLFAY